MPARSRIGSPRNRASRALRRLAVLLLATAPPSLPAQEAPATRVADSALASPARPGDELGDRIRSAFGRIEAFARVEVEAADGVVRLSGTVPEVADVALAKELAGRFDGVLYVENRLKAARDVPSRLAPAMENLREYGSGFVASLPTILIALLVLLAFGLIARTIATWRKPLHRFGLNPLAGGLLRRLIATGVFLVGVVLAFDILGVTALVGAVLGTAGIVGIVLGFAFQKIIESYLAGVLLSARRLFQVSDLVQIGEHQGKVIRLTASDLVLMTLDGNHLRLPNATVFQSPVTNFTRNPLRRLTFTVGVDTGADLSRATRIGRETLSALNGVVADPGPMVQVETLGDSSVVLRFFAWVDQRTSDFLKVRSEAIRLVKKAYDDAEIEMPEPIYRVNLTRRSGADGTAEEARRVESADLPPVADEAADADVSVDRKIEEQIEEDLARSGEKNLLE
ncbi:MAG: mechanosensitive ion channel family protein [Gemmatimonadota bacterium]